MKLTVTKVSGENYCGKKTVSLELSERSIIRGKNKTGKTTVGNMIADPLTGKTMTGSEIDSRPKDENGSAIDHIETKAEVDILVDGTPYTLTKVTRQKWVKNRGESEAKFTGYSNELAISGVPKKQKDYETFLTDLIAPADVRVRCMIPQATLSLDMKKRREHLMAMAEDVTDEVVIKFDLTHAGCLLGKRGRISGKPGEESDQSGSRKISDPDDGKCKCVVPVVLKNITDLAGEQIEAHCTYSEQTDSKQSGTEYFAVYR